MKRDWLRDPDTGKPIRTIMTGRKVRRLEPDPGEQVGDKARPPDTP